MVALLLLALSHQLSALVQLTASEAGVQLLDGYHGSGHAAAPAGGGGGGGGAGAGWPAGGRDTPAGGLGLRPGSRAR